LGIGYSAFPHHPCRKSYKDGKKINDTQYSRIKFVNSSSKDNHFSSKEKKNSPMMININLKGEHNEPKSLG